MLDDLDHPVFAVPLPEGGFLISAHNEPLSRLGADGRSRSPVMGMPANLVERFDHNGMLDLVLDPAYPSNHLIYFSYLAGSLVENSVQVVRAQLEGNTLVNPVLLLDSRPRSARMESLGGRLLMAGDATVLAVIGDRGCGDEAQDVKSDLGKIIRLNRDGSIPADNPFANGRHALPSEKRALPELFSYGHRAPQGLAQQPGNGSIWSAGAEPDTRDEVNIIQSGNNYGWPVTTFMPHGQPGGAHSVQDAKLAADRTTGPVAVWSPGIDPSSMLFYNGKTALLQGKLLVAGTGKSVLRAVTVRGRSSARYDDYAVPGDDGIQDIRSGPDGVLYILTKGRDGQLLRAGP